MRIAVATDHGGLDLKNFLIERLKAWGHEVVDLGTNGTASVDFPDYAPKVSDAVLGGHVDRAVFLCGSGIGSSIAANKVPGLRAALCHDAYSARQSREHNDCNVLCMGGRVVGPELAADIMRVWLEAKFDGAEKYRRRLEKIRKLEGRP